MSQRVNKFGMHSSLPLTFGRISLQALNFLSGDRISDEVQQRRQSN